MCGKLVKLKAKFLYAIKLVPSMDLGSIVHLNSVH